MSKHWVTFLFKKSSSYVTVHTVEEDMHGISSLIMAQDLQTPCLSYLLYCFYCPGYMDHKW